MKHSKNIALAAALLIAGAAFLFANPALAKVKGVCSDCHTMHNSQNGTAMNFDGSSTPNETLLRVSGCLGCHGDDSKAPAWPVVLNSTSEPGVTDEGVVTDNAMTAGGNFYWVETGANDAAGHNIVATNQDDNLQTSGPPGFDGSNFPPKDYSNGFRFSGTWDSAKQLTCAGTNGCHGTPDTENQFGAIAGGHHSNVAGTCDGTDLPHSYRFLYGIMGIEDSDWEYTKSSSDHNQYYGTDRSDLSTGGSDNQTISYLCCQCHGAFHTADNDATSTSPWIRHPTDFDMARATGEEYKYYNGNAAGDADADYSVIAPVASHDLNAGVLSSVKVTNTAANDTAIVTCLSCHRAHGSKFDDILRWKYDLMDAANGTTGDTGCFICHTTKDDS